MTKGGKREWPHHQSVASISLWSKQCWRENLPASIAMPQELLSVNTTRVSVDGWYRGRHCEGQRNGVVLANILRQSEPVKD